MTKTTEIVVTGEPEPPERHQPETNLFSFFPKFNFQFPFLPPKPKPESKTSTLNQQHEASKPNVVRFPKTQVLVPPPLETEAETSNNKTSNPLILWQVYALGGIIVSRWIWARWNERKARGKSPNEDSTEGRHSDDARPSSANE